MLAGTSDGTAEPWVSRNTGVPLRLPAISTYVSPAAGFPFVVPDGSREGTDAPADEGGADAADDDPLLRSPTTPPATRPRPTPITNADTVKLATTTIGRCSEGGLPRNATRSTPGTSPAAHWDSSRRADSLNNSNGLFMLLHPIYFLLFCRAYQTRDSQTC